MSNEVTSSFQDLGLQEWLINQLKAVGVRKPTPIQQHCIPEILKGHNCMGCAKTGSGKTLAFALPIVQEFASDAYGIYAVVLTPTRELAYQIADQFTIIGKPVNMRVSVIVGGMDMMLQGIELQKQPHIVVATPGRLADHLQSCNTFSLKRIKYLVIDEADRLLEGPFNGQLTTIFQALPDERHIMLFSATMSDIMEEFLKESEKKLYIWKEESEVATVDELDQRFLLTPKDVKDGYMVQVILQHRKEHENTSIVVFTKTCKSCQIMAMMLRELGFHCVALHSMISQRERLMAFNKFKSNMVKILLATDVASRGLDIPHVDLVINHSVPREPKDYVHRVGRTARAGRGGMSITLVTQNDINLIHAIEDLINTKLKEFKVDEKEVTKLLTQVAMVKRESEIRLDDMDFDEKRIINKRKQLILEGKDPDKVLGTKHKKKR